MLKTLTLQLTMATALLLPYTAGADAPAVAVDRQCKEFSQDNFDLGWRITSASREFSGQCVNARSVRPISILDKTADRIQFANFYHQGKFWTAEWNRNNIPKVSFLVVHFSGGGPLVKAAHTELLFQFPQAIALRSQTSSQIEKVKEVVISWEAVFTHGGSYDLKTGLRDNFPITGRVASLTARVSENKPAGEGYRKMDRYSLNTTAIESQFLFQQSLAQSHSWQYEHFYNTLSPNCTTRQFDIMDLIIERTRPQVRFASFYTELSLNPVIGPSIQALKQRRLIEADQIPTDLAQELNLR